MKKFSFSVFNLCLLVVVTMMITSCSRKVGCYFSYTPVVEMKERITVTSMDTYSLEKIPASATEMESGTTLCD